MPATVVEEVRVTAKTITYSFTSEAILELLCAAGMVESGIDMRIETYIEVKDRNSPFLRIEKIDESCPLIVKVTTVEKSTLRP